MAKISNESALQIAATYFKGPNLTPNGEHLDNNIKMLFDAAEVIQKEYEKRTSGRGLSINPDLLK